MLKWINTHTHLQLIPGCAEGVSNIDNYLCMRTIEAGFLHYQFPSEIEQIHFIQPKNAIKDKREDKEGREREKGDGLLGGMVGLKEIDMKVTRR